MDGINFSIPSNSSVNLFLFRWRSSSSHFWRSFKSSNQFRISTSSLHWLLSPRDGQSKVAFRDSLPTASVDARTRSLSLITRRNSELKATSSRESISLGLVSEDFRCSWITVICNTRRYCEKRALLFWTINKGSIGASTRANTQDSPSSRRRRDASVTTWCARLVNSQRRDIPVVDPPHHQGFYYHRSSSRGVSSTPIRIRWDVVNH